jgi:hypothetical protein
MGVGITLSDQEGSSVKPGGANAGMVGHKNPLPVGQDYLTAIIWDVNNNPIYVGEALPGTAKSATGWRIKKITWDVNGNPTDIQWANSSMQFSFIMNNYLSYTYA